MGQGGKGPGRGPRARKGPGDGPRQLARRPKETPPGKVSCRNAGCFAKGKPSQEKKHKKLPVKIRYGLVVRTTQVREHKNKEHHKTLDHTNGLQPKRLQARGDLSFQA